MQQVIIDTVTSRLHLTDGAAISPGVARELVRLALEAAREENEHDRRMHQERSLDNGYVERLGSEGR